MAPFPYISVEKNLGQKLSIILLIRLIRGPEISREFFYRFLKLDFECVELYSPLSFPTLPSKQSGFAENNAETDSVEEPNRVSETVRKVSEKKIGTLSNQRNYIGLMYDVSD
jgi:hypothetical protein